MDTDCFQVLVTVNHAAVNRGCRQVPIWLLASGTQPPSVQLAFCHSSIVTVPALTALANDNSVISFLLL